MRSQISQIGLVRWIQQGRTPFWDTLVINLFLRPAAGLGYVAFSDLLGGFML